MISAGQDAGALDPLGRMLITMNGFQAMGKAMRDLAARICQGRLVVLQEGGYSLPHSPFCTLGALEGLSGIHTHVADPWLYGPELEHAQTVFSEETRKALEAARQAHSHHLTG